MTFVPFTAINKDERRGKQEVNHSKIMIVLLQAEHISSSSPCSSISPLILPSVILILPSSFPGGEVKMGNGVYNKTDR